ncbi:MAG: PTS sugar transporter subunit IIC [Peptoniphilus sp.]|nr:PTS sugar transporter subunit IIC [Peptoniphilus sp.]MDD7363483.1 PTS sugar transporter subunit IIC [Bacillota bacterium]MDY6044813.1 PTS sugar transporter subunit IIC [Peptoniphilus sp.]
MKEFLRKKDIHPGFQTYGIDALGAMAYGLFATLLVGTILNTIGSQLNISFLTDFIWPMAQQATGPAIAISIAYALNAPPLVLFASAVVGAGSYDIGGPVAVYIAAIIAAECGKMISKETRIDILLTPAVTVLSGMIVAHLIGPSIQWFMESIGKMIMVSTEQQPFLMGILVSTIVGIALTLPISSAAICMMLSLAGLAGGAATIGCSAQMIGFAVISFKDNGFDGFFAQSLGTSMLQMPNIVKNPRIWIPPTLAGAIISPLSTVVFRLENTPLGSGMGTSGLVGQIGTIQAMEGAMPFAELVLVIVLLHIVLPGALSYFFYRILKKIDWIRDGDMILEI